MRTTCLLLLTSLTFSLLAATPNNSQDTKAMNSQNRQRVTSTVNVQHSDAKVYDDDASPTLKELTLQETFSGDIAGTSLVRALQIFHGKGSARMTSVQRFKGTLAKRSGTFVLQGAETIKDGKIEATWFVVPGSGTEELAGLRGEGGFAGDFGKGSQAYLDYWFE
jgi:hypothetical protein